MTNALCVHVCICVRVCISDYYGKKFCYIVNFDNYFMKMTGQIKFSKSIEHLHKKEILLAEA